MTTLTGNSGATPPLVSRGGTWSGRHALISTLGIIVLAVVCGTLLGLLIDTASHGPAQATVHRAGAAHGRTGALLAVQQTLAAEEAAAAESSGEAGAGTRDATAVKEATFSRARGGFPVGRGQVGTDRL